MTREEAIYKANHLRKVHPNICIDAEVFWETVIAALEQEPKTGHWEWVQYDGNPSIGNWHCSECGSIVIACVSKEYKGGISYKYCPNCGAKME